MLPQISLELIAFLFALRLLLTRPIRPKAIKAFYGILEMVTHQKKQHRSIIIQEQAYINLN